MGKLDELSKKISDAAEEVADTVNNTIEKANNPENKEMVHKALNDVGNWIGHAADALDKAVNEAAETFSKEYHNKQ